MKQRKKKEDIQSTPDKLNLQGKSNKVRVIGNIGSSSYREFEANNRK